MVPASWLLVDPQQSREHWIFPDHPFQVWWHVPVPDEERTRTPPTVKTNHGHTGTSASSMWKQ